MGLFYFFLREPTETTIGVSSTHVSNSFHGSLISISKKKTFLFKERQNIIRFIYCVFLVLRRCWSNKVNMRITTTSNIHTLNNFFMALVNKVITRIIRMIHTDSYSLQNNTDKRSILSIFLNLFFFIQIIFFRRREKKAKLMLIFCVTKSNTDFKIHTWIFSATLQKKLTSLPKAPFVSHIHFHV